MSTRPQPPRRERHAAASDPQPRGEDELRAPPASRRSGAKRRPLLTVSQQPDPAIILGGIPDAVVSLDRQWRFVYVNHTAAALAHRSPEEMLGRSIWELFPQPSASRVSVEFNRAMEEQLPILFEEFSRHLGRWFEHRLFPSPEGLTAISRDVTDRRNAEHTRASLLEVARTIAGAELFEDLLDEVQGQTRTALACDVVATIRFDDTTGVFRVVRQLGCPPEIESELAALTFMPFEPFGGRLAHGPVLETSTSGPELVRRLCERFGWSSVLVAPMRLHNRQLGALLAAFRDGARVVTPWEIELCAGIAQQLAVALARVEAHRSEQDDAAVSAALARLGHRLLASFDHPNLLERICELTAEAVGCSRCVTFLWRPEEDAFVPTAAYGVPATQSEEIRVLGLRADAVPKLIRRLTHEEVLVQTDLPPDERDAIPSRLQPLPGAIMLMMGLRRGEQLIGFQVAVQDPVDRPFTPAQLRIARGTMLRTSMAIEHGLVLEQLERATRLKSEFVGMMSHELRTPLHVVLGYADLLLDGALGALDEQQLDALRRMQRSGKDLLELVRGLLDMNRLETGRMPVSLSEVEPADLMAEVERYGADLQRAPGVILHTRCRPQMHPVFTDRAKVVTILRNLIGNALKFTRDGRVEATIDSTADGFCLTVSDTGEGIASEMVPHIFEPFRQGEASTPRTQGGVGLGLYIVRRMVEALGGHLEVETEPGHGSTFRVTIPEGRRPRRGNAGPARRPGPG